MAAGREVASARLLPRWTRPAQLQDALLRHRSSDDVIGADHVAALTFGNDAHIMFPGFGKDGAGALAVFVEPADFFRPAKKNAAQDETARSFRMYLGVGECESAAPRTAKHEPLFDAEVFAKAFDVGH